MSIAELVEILKPFVAGLEAKTFGYIIVHFLLACLASYVAFPFYLRGYKLGTEYQIMRDIRNMR